MLSKEVSDRLAAAAKKQTAYQPNEAVSAKLRERSLVMFVGPAAVGKSYLMNHLAEADSDFTRVPVFSTRDRRPDDEPGMFRLSPHDDEHVGRILDQIDSGDVVQYAVHPTSGRLYGSTLQDFSGRYNMLATLSGVVDHLRQLPFKQTFTIGLSVRPDVWRQRFDQRYPEISDEKSKRLKEAKTSLQWLLQPSEQPQIIWVDNTPADSSATVQSVLSSIKYTDRGDMAALDTAQSLLRYIEEEAQ